MARWVDGWMHGWMDEDDEDNFAKRYQLFPPGCFQFQVVSMQTATSRIACNSFFFKFSFQVNVYNLFWLLVKLEKRTTHFEWFPRSQILLSEVSCVSRVDLVFACGRNTCGSQALSKIFQRLFLRIHPKVGNTTWRYTVSSVISKNKHQGS